MNYKRKKPKKRMPLETSKLWGLELLLPGRISFNIMVPASVPSLFHSSMPLVPLLAAKYMAPLYTVTKRGSPPKIPARISFTGVAETCANIDSGNNKGRRENIAKDKHHFLIRKGFGTKFHPSPEGANPNTGVIRLTFR